MKLFHHNGQIVYLVITGILLLWFFSVDWNNTSSNLDNIADKISIHQKNSILKRNLPKVILYWNTFFNHTDFLFGFGQEPFINAGCKVNNCMATNDRNLFNQSDAIIFHAGNYDENDIDQLLTYRFPHQRFIFLNLETLPDSFDLPCFSRQNFFNWTMSHRRDSDVYLGIPYGALKRKKNSAIIEQFPKNLESGERPPKPFDFFTKKYFQFTNKTKLVAWFNSHCPTHSQREDYVKKLAKFIPVDIYGKCGTLECLPRLGAECDGLLANYKFYLAFENSLCPDYVSEKLYRAFISKVVPVVYGGADYAQYAPPNSYINIADFKSPKELSEYLSFLANNDAMYSKYYDWKDSYEVIRHPPDGWCDLCEKLNDPATARKSYFDLAKWWYKDVPCMPGSFYIRSTYNP